MDMRQVSRPSAATRAIDKKPTEHHLAPKAVHAKKRYANRFGKKEMRERAQMICKQCRYGIHDLIPDEKELP
jgi:hypothetical protein